MTWGRCHRPPGVPSVLGGYPQDGSSIDSAVARLREASTEAGSKAQDQVSNWRGTLEEATDDVRKELGKLGVRAQTSVQALDEIAAELAERRKSLGS